MTDLRSLQQALGGEINGRQLLCPGPGHSPRDRSLSVWLTPDGDIKVHSHAGDDWQTCKDDIRERLGWPAWRPGDGYDRRVDSSRLKAFDRAAIEAENGPREWTPDELVRIERAAAIWNAAVDPRGTTAEQYLRSRVLVLDDGIANTVLRFHPACPWRDENSGQTIFIPALIALFTSVDNNTVTAIHRIRVDQPQRWPKADRMMLGPVRRAAVQLGSANSTLSIGEGVETALAARQLGLAPVWATGSAGMISKFPLIDGVTTLRLLGETGTASAEAVRYCGNRWHRAGRQVRVIMPTTGDDLNSELMAMSA